MFPTESSTNVDSTSFAGTEAPPRNRILAALPEDDLRRLTAGMERVPLKLRQVIIDPNQPFEHVYFPEDSVVSVVSLMEDGSAIEAATVGNEGMTGVPAYLGPMQMAAQAFVQVSGSAWRLPVCTLLDEVRGGDGALARMLARYTQALFTQVSQCSACNRKHAVEQRCARWLLMTHDRVDGDSFDLTQLFLSQMLGVRRATVNEVAGALQQRGLIEYTRGRIAVLDRAGLEAASCVCYAVIRAEFARMLYEGDVQGPLDGMLVAEDGMTTTGDGAPDPGAERT